MDLAFTSEEEAFREEVRQFLRDSVPCGIRRKLVEGQHPSKDELVSWWRILNKRGWGVTRWPCQYGGTGWSSVKQHIFTAELQMYPAPPPLAYGVGMVGPVIYPFGNDAQKKHYLPRIANVDDWWCQGFSEPDSGSDLASLRTKAERRGKSWIISGQKTWITFAQHADMIFCLCRTDPIDGGHEINEIFFDEVVSIENLVGEENRGWSYAKFLLGNERTGIARVGVSKERLRRIREIASNVKSGGRSVLEEPAFREKLMSCEIELKALELTQLRVAAFDDKHKDTPDPTSSVLKIKGTELQQATAELLMEVIGPFAARSDERPDASNEMTRWAAHIAPSYFNGRKLSIYGGSNEIQRNIIRQDGARPLSAYHRESPKSAAPS
ncbi:acyl-CoA dehydrogenase family protein [Bradyrhizobium sp. 143]|nr:acyl-CoA dehydrogenase family protein [Bradyrhizobium sp. 143]